MGSVTLQAVLAEVGGYEDSVRALYQQGLYVTERGQMTPELSAAIAQHGDRLYTLESAVYDLVVAMVRAAPGGAPYVEQIPRPTRLGTPPTNGGLGAAQAVPVLGWVAAVVVVIAAIAAIAWILTSAVQSGTELVRTILQQREETTRYTRCLASSATPADCVSVAPPHAPPRPGAPWLWIGVGAAALAVVGGLAYVAYRRYGGRIPGLSAYPNSLGTGTLRRPALRRALAGGYNMEV